MECIVTKSVIEKLLFSMNYTSSPVRWTRALDGSEKRVEVFNVVEHVEREAKCIFGRADWPLVREACAACWLYH